MLTLHTYWRSSAAYRVRIALNVKRLDYIQRSHDLRKGEQKAPAYMAIAPHGLVPALEADGKVMIQSPAILEWIEESFPEPALLPADAYGRATVRAMAAIIGCDIHPLNNLRVLKALKALKADHGADDTARLRWIAQWMEDGFGALEQMIKAHGGEFAFGNALTLADCYLVPQAYSADRYGVKLDDFPNLRRVVASAQEVPAVAAAHPSRQPDADPD